MTQEHKTHTIELPVTVSFEMQRDAGVFSLDLTKLTQATVVGLIAAGARETSGNAGGKVSQEEYETEELKAEAAARYVRETAERIQNNEHRFGAGGGGARLSPTVAVARETVASWLQDDGLAKNQTQADKMVIADLRGAFDQVAGDQDYESFLKDCASEANRRAKNAARRRVSA